MQIPCTAKWIKRSNILAFPYAWQTPAKTEEWAYLRCLESLPDNLFIQVICFPWATLVDLLRQGKTVKAALFIEALKATPPRITLVRVTICQHIYMRDLLPFFKQLKITHLFWTHAVIDEPFIEGIKIYPFPLYPVRYIERLVKSIKPLSQRRYLYSFVGAYDADLYLTPVRQWLFDLPANEKGLIEQRNAWHYQAQVYGEQISGKKIKIEQLEKHQQSSQDYETLLAESIFCLCPSGSGANSIRLWEALGFGCIPVILSDTLKLPGDKHLWKAATLKISETEENIKALPRKLSDHQQSWWFIWVTPSKGFYYGQAVNSSS